ncbi:MAG: 16S rRNA (cytidine(1402)-2'-O)-methyltransferase [Armatimonadetes bacterium]|nr:16S rRNA (cytidine(1402)-2'-O)-methyltransferase [Armatimonadota bacterium]
MSSGAKPGTLYVVATPIGNLEDLSARAARILREVDLIAAEDTRRVAKLLSAYGISRPITSFHSYSSQERLSEILQRLLGGADVALVSDAGTPCISDPGCELVSAALDTGVRVVTVPGPCAAIAALAASGLPAGRFFFAGYLPRKSTQRRQLLEEALSAPWPVVFYEAGRRLPALLRDIAESTGGERLVVVARELTKLHEEIVRGPVGELLKRYPGSVKGEVTVVAAPAKELGERAPLLRPQELARWLVAEGLSPGRVAAALVHFCGLTREQAYELATSLSRAQRP